MEQIGEVGGQIILEAATVEMFKQRLRDQVLYNNGPGGGAEVQQPLQFNKFEEIMQEFTDVKNQIRQAAFKDAKIGEVILTNIRSLEKLMDEDFNDLIGQVNGISKRLDDLNADFFTKIFRDILKQELKQEGDSQTNKVIASIQGLKHEIIDSQHCSHHKDTKSVQTEKSFLEQALELVQELNSNNAQYNENFDRNLYIKYAEQYTKDKEYQEKFGQLFDFGFTNFDVNKSVFIDKTMDFQLAVALIMAKYEDELETDDGKLQGGHKNYPKEEAKQRKKV